jgi:hypothetical protein
MQPFELIDRGLVFDASTAELNQRACYFTCLAQLDSGTLLAGWQSGPTKKSPTNTIRIARSSDQGVSWQAISWNFENTLDGIPGSLATAEMVEVEAGRLLLFSTWFDRSDPDRPLFDPDTEGILHSRQVLCISTDDGESWSDWQVIPTPGLTGCATTGPVLKWSDGTIAHAFESFKEYDDPEPAVHGAWLLVSRDGGRSFEPPWLVARDPQDQVYYWDQRLYARETPGEFLSLFWTHDRAAQKDLNLHMLQASLDEGTGAASQPVATSIPGQIAAAGVTDDGRLLAFIVDRGKPGTLTLWQSEDGGNSWPGEARLVVHVHDEQAALSQDQENIDFAEYWEDMGRWSFGHPAMIPLSGGEWLLAYYAGTPDTMSIHSVRVRG